MGSFEDAVLSWRNRPFPHGSTDDALDQLHADLALADTWVAESVIPFVNNARYQPAEVDVIAELGELRSRAIDLAGASSDENQQMADSYRDYAELLLRVYEGFLAQGNRL